MNTSIDTLSPILIKLPPTPPNKLLNPPLIAPKNAPCRKSVAFPPKATVSKAFVVEAIAILVTVFASNAVAVTFEPNSNEPPTPVANVAVPAETTVNAIAVTVNVSINSPPSSQSHQEVLSSAS